MRKLARPKKNIDKKQFVELCGLQCTKKEICAVLEVTDKTLDRWVADNYEGKSFSEVFEEKRVRGFVSLRRKQFQLAEKNATLAIWLGKQYLGQKDTTTLNREFDNRKPSEDDPHAD